MERGLQKDECPVQASSGRISLFFSASMHIMASRDPRVGGDLLSASYRLLHRAFNTAKADGFPHEGRSFCRERCPPIVVAPEQSRHVVPEK